MFALLIERAESETRILRNELKEIEGGRGSEELRQVLADNLLKIREFKEENSMNFIAEKAVDQTVKKRKR